MPQFETALYGAQIFWLLISFGFLYLMISQLICPMIEETLTEREKKIQDILDRAEKVNHEAMDFHQRYQTYMMDAEKEKSQKIQQAYQAVHKKIHRLEAQNEARLKQRIRSAEEKINKTAEALNEESDQISTQLAERLSRHLTHKETIYELD